MIVNTTVVIIILSFSFSEKGSKINEFNLQEGTTDDHDPFAVHLWIQLWQLQYNYKCDRDANLSNTDAAKYDYIAKTNEIQDTHKYKQLQ